MTKKTVTETQETTIKTITLELPVNIAAHLGQLLNVAQFSGNAAELRQLLTTHDELIARFNEAVNGGQ